MGIDVARQDFIGGGVNGCLEEFVGIGVWSLVQVGEKWKGWKKERLISKN